MANNFIHLLTGPAWIELIVVKVKSQLLLDIICKLGNFLEGDMTTLAEH